ncbi:MAG TPA: YihY/virulence factor BrkB family protein [Blastocatellia bacterium]|nr:YihY/virulence factor BrkB family protein [Blastocatellia bacterium]
MSRGVFGGLTLKQLAQRTWKESNEDNVFGSAAELAYYFLLALFPMLIFLTSLVGFMPGAQESIFNGLSKVVPGDAMRLVRDTLQDVVSNRSGGLLSFGVLGTIWAASNGVAAVMSTLNVAYDVEEERSFLKSRATAVGLTVALAVLFIGGTVLIMFGDKLADWIARLIGLDGAFAAAWHVVDYALGLAMLFIGIELIYYFGPNAKQEWRWITPGAVFAVAMIIIGSLLFSLYLRFAPSYSATYGSLGAVIILMLWLYLMGLAVLAGGEINSEVERAASKPVVEKEPPERLHAA